MKILTLFTFLFLSITILHSQPEQREQDSKHSKNCNPAMIQKLDSVVNYGKETYSDLYTPADVFIYEFDGNDHYTKIERLSLPSRIPVNRQNYFFDNDGRKSHYILQYWDGTGYNDSHRFDYSYDESGRLSREVYSGLTGEGVWEPYQQHFYNYDDQGVTLTYLRQMKDASGEWYDFSYKNYIYNEAGQLIERNEQRVADDVIFWAETFTYDAAGRTSERVRLTLKYNPATGTSELVNLNKQIYSYDMFGEMSAYHVETWTNGAWVLTGKSVYYRSFIKGRKVAVCHNGHTLMLPPPAVVAHLRHGDYLGCCKYQWNPGEHQENRPGKKDQDLSIVVFPNPATSEITVYLPEVPDKPAALTLHSKNGSLVLRKKMSGQSETYNISHLLPGSYLLTVESDSGTITKTVIKE